MNRVNYSVLCDEILSDCASCTPRKKLLLHVCCAPCSSSVIEYLEPYFDITLFFYNPNISDKEEFYYRLSELQRFVEERPQANLDIITPLHEPEDFFAVSSGLESEAEGGARCLRCYRQRLEATAAAASERGFDFFTTTLSVSPYKNASTLNMLGEELETKYSVRYLISDFKKKNGYLRSIELSNAYGLYRQDYCGCSFSQKAALERKAAKEKL